MGKQIIDYCREQPIGSGLLIISALLLLFNPFGFFMRFIMLAILIYTTLQAGKNFNL